jgi:hypothetical protein
VGQDVALVPAAALGPGHPQVRLAAEGPGQVLAQAGTQLEDQAHPVVAVLLFGAEAPVHREDGLASQGGPQQERLWAVRGGEPTAAVRPDPAIQLQGEVGRDVARQHRGRRPGVAGRALTLHYGDLTPG